MYLIVARYSDDAERKRIDYLLEKWKQRLKVFKPEGTAILLDGVREEEAMVVVQDLLGKVSEEKVSFYRVEPLTIETQAEQRELEASIKGDRKSVERLVNFLLARYRGVLRGESALGRTYEVYTRRGRAEVVVSFHEREQSVDLRIRIIGHREVADALHQKLQGELKYLKEA